MEIIKLTDFMKACDDIIAEGNKTHTFSHADVIIHALQYKIESEYSIELHQKVS